MRLVTAFLVTVVAGSTPAFAVINNVDLELAALRIRAVSECAATLRGDPNDPSPGGGRATCQCAVDLYTDEGRNRAALEALTADDKKGLPEELMARCAQQSARRAADMKLSPAPEPNRFRWDGSTIWRGLGGLVLFVGGVGTLLAARRRQRRRDLITPPPGTRPRRGPDSPA